MDTVALVVGILAQDLGVPVSTEVPPTRPQRFALVSLDGDMSDPFILRPRFTIMCWGTTDIDAHGIALSALHALADASQTHPYLSAVQLESLARDEWGRDGQARYALQVVCIINTDQ